MGEEFESWGVLELGSLTVRKFEDQGVLGLGVYRLEVYGLGV